MPDDNDFLDKLERDYLEQQRKRDFQESSQTELKDLLSNTPVAPQKVIVTKRGGCRGGACLIVVLGIVLCVGAFAGLMVYLLKPVHDAGNAFMGALRDEEYLAAYNMMSPEAQEDLGSSANLRSELSEFNVRPVSWTLGNWNVNGSYGRVSGTVQLEQDSSQSLTIEMVNQDGWKVTNFHFGQRSYP